MNSIPTDPSTIELTDNLSAKFNVGIQGRVAYSINVTNSISITPQYLYHLGISNEFNDYAGNTKSMRHYVCIGIAKRLL